MARASTVGLALLLAACSGDAVPSDPGNDDTTPGPIASVAISPSASSFASFGERVALTAHARDEQGRDITGAPFEWTSSDTAVVVVRAGSQPSPRATARSVANGAATITATTSGIKGTVSVVVEQQPARIVSTPSNPVVEFPGDTLWVAAGVTDARGNEMPSVTVTWLSESPSVATVDAAGLVTGQGFGTATLAATAGQVQATVSFGVIGDRFFLNDEVRLRYDLDLPDASGGPFPAVVFIHGSGMATRNTQTDATDPLVPQGVAVLRYDKRGVGESTGTFFNIGPLNSNASLRTLARDAAAAVRFLKNFSEIDPERIGVMGNSQGGWIGPLAADEADDVSFMLMWSGPTVSVGLEIFYSSLADGTSMPLDAVYQQLPTFSGAAGYDPLPTLERLDIPSLWLYGAMDRSIPSRLDTLNMKHLRSLGKPYDFIMYPYGRHDLRDSRTGRFIDLWSDYVRWLQERGIL